jgi:hypothetical protein
VTSAVYELCWILTEKYVLVFLVSCGFSVDFSFMTVFGDRRLNLDFLCHDFLVAHPIYFDLLSSGVESLSCPFSAHTSPACPLLLVQSPARSHPFVISAVLSDQASRALSGFVWNPHCPLGSALGPEHAALSRSCQ